MSGHFCSAGGNAKLAVLHHDAKEEFRMCASNSCGGARSTLLQQALCGTKYSSSAREAGVEDDTRCADFSAILRTWADPQAKVSGSAVDA